MGKLDDRMNEILDSISANGFDNISEEDKLFLKYEAEGMAYKDIVYRIHLELNPQPEKKVKQTSNEAGDSDMKLLDICFPTPEEENLNEEEFVKEFELTGKIYASIGEEWASGEAEGEYDFYLGPCKKGGTLSDAVTIDEYLRDVCDSLNINRNTLDVGIGENLHMLYVDDDDRAKLIFAMIIKAIKNDGYEIEYARA